MAIDKTINLGVDTGDSKKDVEGLNQSLGKTGGSAGGAKKGLKSLSGGFKGVGMAMKAMGIGLIIAAFVKLKDLFSGNIETARKFERIGAKLAAMFDVVRDAVEPLFLSLMEAFENPQQAIKDLWTALKENIVNRIKGLIDSFGALGKVIKGVFSKDLDMIRQGAAEAKEGFLQLATGMDEVARGEAAEKLKKKFKEITEEMKKEGDEAARLTGIMQDVRDEERDMLMIRAKANKQIAESRLLAEDDTKSKKERLEALKAAVSEEQRVAQIELDIQEKKVNAMQAMIDLGKSSEEDIQKLAEERARFIELQTGSILRQKRVAAEVGVFTAQVEKEKTDAENAALKRSELLVKTKELNLVITEELTNKEIAALIKAEETKLGIIQKAADAEEKIKEQRIASVKKMEISGAKSILGTIGQLAGEGTKMAKATALSSILINTAQAISGAIKAGAGIPFPGNLGAMITGVASALSGIASAKAIFAKVPGGGDSVPDADVSTSAQMPGGIGGNLIPNIESIIPGGANGIQPVQAYVVENDISNSQALQEELDIQATL